MMRPIKFLFSVMRPYRWAMIAAAGMGFLTSGSHLGLLMVSAYILAKAALLPPVAELQIAIAAVRLFGLARGVFRYAERIMSHTLAFRLMTAMRIRLYDIMQLKPVSAIADSAAAEWFSRFIHDVAQMEHFYIRVLAPVITAGLMWILALLVFGMFDPLIALIVSIFFMINSLVIPWFVHRRAGPVSEETEGLKAMLTRASMDWIDGQADIRIAGQVHHHRNVIGEISDGYCLAQKRFSSITAAHEAGSAFIMNLCVAAVVLYCLPLIQSGQMNGLYFSVILIGVMAGFESIHAIPYAAQNFSFSVNSAKKLVRIDAGESVPVQRVSTLQPLEPVNWTFQDADFSYPASSRPVFRGLSARISGKGLTAVIGPSGCGKTTLLRMMLGFDLTQRGQMFVGGKNILECDIEELRRRISFCNQNAYIFSGTIRENIHLGQPDATDDEIIQSAKEACIHDFIVSLPDGYDTHAGRHGYRLSGGERQRIALARALVKKSEILMLDEPTAHLDPDTENKIFRFIRHCGRYRAVIVVTHQIAWTSMADDIILLNNGKAAAQGNHAELIQKSSFYSEWFKQEQMMI